MPAFEKLVENLINIYKFTSMHDTYEDLKVDCVNFLFETIHKFDETRGSNAFSYFNVVAKNWLIIKTKQKAQKMKRLVSLDDPDSLSSYETCLIDEHNYIPFKDGDTEFSNRNDIVNMLFDIRTKVKSENELSCINSVITIFENIDDIDLLPKNLNLNDINKKDIIGFNTYFSSLFCYSKRWIKSKHNYNMNFPLITNLKLDPKIFFKYIDDLANNKYKDIVEDILKFRPDRYKYDYPVRHPYGMDEYFTNFIIYNVSVLRLLFK
jgi:hypothetical protein